MTQETSRVEVRNPPKSKKENHNSGREKIHRDPLAQSFTVPGPGIFLTAIDSTLQEKILALKSSLNLELWNLVLQPILVADWCEVALNPADINIANPFEPVPTRVTFPSPTFLEGGIEYAIVILSPASDGYEMWTATMGKKTVRTTSLPDVQNVVVSKQYIGGSL